MAAVCGPRAVNGECKHSVVQQLSTIPEWMYEGGWCSDGSPSCLPENGWNTTNPFSMYLAGGALVDKTCQQMARYVARVVGWYTAGGFHDECGHWHPSTLNYTWWGLSVLNEDEHHIQPDNGAAYTTCFDAIVDAVSKVNPTIVPIGPEIEGSNLDYLLYFLDPSHHSRAAAPPVGSWHAGVHASNSSAVGFFTQWDIIRRQFVQPIEEFRKKIGSQTEMVLNEFIPYQADWCDCKGVENLCGGERFPASCPDWQDPATAGGDPNLQHAKGIGMNKATWSCNAAAAAFAYAFGTLAEARYKFVAQDQLVGGTWPDNEPSGESTSPTKQGSLSQAHCGPFVPVSCLDWQSGLPNAKYHVTRMLATTVGDASEKLIHAVNMSVVNNPRRAWGPGTNNTGTCGDTTFMNRSQCDSEPRGAFNASQYRIRTLAECVTMVAQCRMGNYASFSTLEADCSWYQQCDMGNLDVVGRGYISEVIAPFTPPGGEGAELLYAMPYTKAVGASTDSSKPSSAGDDGASGLLLVSKVPEPLDVVLEGTNAAARALATVVEVSPDDPETALNPPVTRIVGKDGTLRLGPFAVAIVDLGSRPVSSLP